MEITVIETSKSFERTKVSYVHNDDGETPSLKSVLEKYDPGCAWPMLESPLARVASLTGTCRCAFALSLATVASPHYVICSDLCTGFKNVKTWRVSNPRRVSLLLELISQVYVTATPSRLSLLNLAIHRVVRECIVLLLCWQVSTHARLFVIYVQYINDTTATKSFS